MLHASKARMEEAAYAEQCKILRFRVLIRTVCCCWHAFVGRVDSLVQTSTPSSGNDHVLQLHLCTSTSSRAAYHFTSINFAPLLKSNFSWPNTILILSILQFRLPPELLYNTDFAVYWCWRSKVDILLAALRFWLSESALY
jgi:hypothetical protein